MKREQNMKNVTTFKNSPPEVTLQLELEQVDSEIAHLQTTRKQIVARILDLVGADMAAKLKAKDEPFGSVHTHGFDLTIPKKVSWDSLALASIAEQIKAAGEDPLEYVKIEYSVSEAAYKAWPKSIQDTFRDARTVQPGSVSVKISKKGE